MFYLRICITISNIIYCSLENCIINQKISMCIPFKNLKTLISVTVCLLIPTPRYLYFILNQSSVPEKLLFFFEGHPSHRRIFFSDTLFLHRVKVFFLISFNLSDFIPIHVKLPFWIKSTKFDFYKCLFEFCNKTPHSLSKALFKLTSTTITMILLI